MSMVIKFVCDLPDGIHARPASLIETLCNTFQSAIEWHNLRTTQCGNAKSALSLISTDTLRGDECQISIQGTDERQAFQQISQFIKNDLLHCDASLPVAEQQTDPLPESLSRLNPTLFFGHSVCVGSASGQLTIINSPELPAADLLPARLTTEKELTALEKAISQLTEDLQNRLVSSDHTAAAVLSAHLSLVRDSTLREHLSEGIRLEMRCAEAIIRTMDYFCQKFTQSDSLYIRERVLDIRGICFQLLRYIYGDQCFPVFSQLQQPTICVADELTPAQFLELDKKWLRGLILRHGGTTSHTVILARSFNIPTLVGVDISSLTPWIHQQVQIDGNSGVLVVQLNEAIRRYYQQEEHVQRCIRERQYIWKTRQGYTADRKYMEIAANIAHCAEAAAVFTHGAESIGLFRTEMLYMDRACAPSEDEQYEIYCQALEAVNGKDIIIRTMDIGGDKPVDYLNIPVENNPFLGYRAVRIYAEYLALFHAQLRAILRASAHGSLKIMIPMVSSLDEIIWVKRQVDKIKLELTEKAIPFNDNISLGIMLEVPSVIFIIDQCCEEIDFFSIGSNDLTQYLMATDRDNNKVSHQYNSLNPAFLRALDYAVQVIHRHGKWVGLCGEFAAKGSALPLLVGMGLDEISMNAPSIPSTKAHLATLNSHDCRQLLEQAINCRTAQEVEKLLAQFRVAQQDAPLITPQCITLDSDWRSKEEVIKGMTDALLLAERCRYPRKLEADLWAREAVFATSLGFGFAIPHSKSEHIEQSTISVARLSNPISWGEEKVQFIIMLTLNKHTAGDQHMRIFSRLARRIMHPEFRNSLVNASSSDEIATLLRNEILQ